MSGTITINSTDLANAIKPQLLQMPEISIQPYSYIIFTDGTNYYAKNGKTGQIDFSGTDASTVIQNAINSLAEGGGKIYIKAGVYRCKSQIDLTKARSIVIEGEGYSTFPPTWPRYGTILYKDFDGVLINAEYPSGEGMYHSPFLRNLVIVGKNTGYYQGYTTGPAISVSNAYNFAFENVQVYRVETGIKFRNVGMHRLMNVTVNETMLHGFDMYNVADGLWNNVESCDNNQQPGYSAFNLDTCWLMINNIHAEGYRAISILNNGFVYLSNVFVPWARERAVYITATTFIVNGLFYGANVHGEFTGDQAATIYIDSAGTVIITNSYIDLYTSKSNYSIKTNTSGFAAVTHLVNSWFNKPVVLLNDCKVVNCHFENSFTAYNNTLLLGNRFSKSATIASGRAENNIGFNTVNSGRSVFSGDGATMQFAIAHGLPGTPSKVLVTPGSSNAIGTFYVTADATNIYVNYSTAPPAGTNNIVLYWYAEV